MCRDLVIGKLLGDELFIEKTYNHEIFYSTNLKEAEDYVQKIIWK